MSLKQAIAVVTTGVTGVRFPSRSIIYLLSGLNVQVGKECQPKVAAPIIFGGLVGNVRGRGSCDRPLVGLSQNEVAFMKPAPCIWAIRKPARSAHPFLDAVKPVSLSDFPQP